MSTDIVVVLCFGMYSTLTFFCASGLEEVVVEAHS